MDETDDQVGVGLKQLFLSGKGRSWVLTGVVNMRHGEQFHSYALPLRRSLPSGGVVAAAYCILQPVVDQCAWRRMDQWTTD